MTALSDITGLRILVVEDHLMFSQGLEELLRKIAPDARLSSVTSAQSAKEVLQKNKVHFILCDLLIPGTDVKEFISFCKKKYPATFIIIISSVTDIHTIKTLFAEGVNGYLSKAVDHYELKLALEKVGQGERYLSTDLSGKLATIFFREEESSLTRKELEILRIIADGKTVKQIAEILLISPSTVMAHRRNIMAKLDLHSAAELVKYAYDNKLV